MEDAPSILHRRLQSGPIIVCPGAYDTLGAFLIEQAGHEAVYVTGGGISYSALARPDIGLLSYKEMVDRVMDMIERVTVPLVVDADTGYGGVHNMRRTIATYKRFGVGAIQIEDQELPKRCGHLSGKRLVPVEEMVAKIRAAVHARQDSGPLIITRTDACAVTGIDDAVRRGRAYLAAGADVMFIEAPESDDDLQMLPHAFDGHPLMANMLEGGKTPFHAAPELDSMGYRMVIYPNSVARAVAFATDAVARSLKQHGTTEPIWSQMWLFERLVATLGIEELSRLDSEFAATSEDGTSAIVEVSPREA